jgi:phage shock protein A
MDKARQLRIDDLKDRIAEANKVANEAIAKNKVQLARAMITRAQELQIRLYKLEEEVD